MSEPSTSPLDEDLRALLRAPDLDALASREPERVHRMLARARDSTDLAWATDADANEARREAARLETQRALYAVNRLKFFWFDTPAAYVNERSPLLQQWQRLLEEPWQAWLAAQVPRDGLDGRETPQQVLERWVERERLAPPTDGWFGREASLEAYRELLRIASLNGLVEASQLSRVMGGASHPVQSTLFRILMEEYGAGRPHKKHSTFFAQMLEQQGLSSTPETYFERVPWQVLSSINHAFFLSENRRYFLRFAGAFTYTELSTPVSFRDYARAAARLGLSDGRSDYWSLHVREDERHGAWMVSEVALPLLAQFPDCARDVLFGYAQQRSVEALAADATLRAARRAHQRRGEA